MALAKIHSGTALAGQPAAAATDDPGTQPDGKHIRWSLVLMAAGIALGSGIEALVKPAPFIPRPGISLFAVFYIVAQALERLAEIIKLILPGIGAAKVGQDKKTKSQAVAERNKTLAEIINKAQPAVRADLETAMKGLAEKQKTVNTVRANRTVLLWAINSAVASLAAGYFGLFLLQVVGMSRVPDFVDIAVTSLVLGGGTKPLHDLISNIENSKKQKEDPPETA